MATISPPIFAQPKEELMTRTDNDSWDLASSVGATATMVAASRALASQAPDPLINDPYAKPLVRAVDVDFFTRLVSGQIRDENNRDATITMQQMAEGIAVRTRFFDDVFTGAAEAGVRQAVILASGLDSRAYRLPWPTGTVVYEIDQPQVIEFKTRTLAELGATPNADRRPVGIDLRDDWPTALRDNGFDSAAPTAWIGEGLLMFLPPTAQDRLFDNITALSAPGSRLATDDPNTSIRANQGVPMAGVWRQHGFDMETSHLAYRGERSDVTDYLSARGWLPTAQTLFELYGANGLTFPDDEAFAAFADVTFISAMLS
jgi:methyltransferase (TIGR00027 family)